MKTRRALKGPNPVAIASETRNYAGLFFLLPQNSAGLTQSHFRLK